MNRILSIFGVCCLAVAVPSHAESPRETEVVYKQVGEGTSLQMLVDYPEDWQATDQRPAVVIFHGGGWTQGTHRSFGDQTRYLVSRGMVAFRVQYRLLSGDGPAIPAVCTQDARSAMRYVRAHAGRFGIDPGRIVSCGGSAGAHLAAAVAIDDGLDDPQDDLAVLPKPQAMILLNPALDLLMEAELRGVSLNARQTAVVRQISPQQHLGKDTPPSLICFGDQDRLLPHGTNFAKEAKQVGARADLHVYADAGHTFWRRPYFETEILYLIDEFLASLGYLEGSPTIARPTPEELKKGAALELERLKQPPGPDDF